MLQIPRDKSLDSSVALLGDPYRFISKRCRSYGSDLFETRLLLEKTTCMTGRQAAELFYDPQLFIRRGVVPAPIVKTLFGQGGVQGLDGEAHRHRKQMFLSLMTPERIAELGQITYHWFHRCARRWQSMGKLTLYEQVQEVLTRSACQWSGVPLDESEVGKRTRELAALFDQAASLGIGHWYARLARRRCDRWLSGLIDQIRSGQLHPPEECAAMTIAWHRDLDGKLLSPQVAAVELNNVVRPTVAISAFIVFAALALHDHPECREKLASDEDGYLEWFAQEVRRFYPFFPAAGARVRHDFHWQGYDFPAGRRVLLDLYGTNHDERLWHDPEHFQPERFRDFDGDPFTLIPQGAGEHAITHRCPGEWITIELLKVASQFLATQITYDVPAQDLRLAMSRLPAVPHSRFLVTNVRAVRAPASIGMPG